MVGVRVLVLGAGGSAADNFIKSLRMADSDVFVVGADVNPYLLELSSADETVLLETRPVDGDAHWEAILDLVDDHAITMVHAQPDEETLFLSDQVWAIEDRMFLPDVHVIAACQDKLRCAELLGDYAPASQSFGASPFGRGRGPMWMRARRGAGSLAAKKVDNIGAADAWQMVWEGRVDYDDFMLSDYLAGRDVSYTGVWWKGEPVAAACRERVEYADTRTPSGQSSSPRVARLCSEDKVFDRGEAAIRRVNEALGAEPHGVFYVDMKEDAAGTPMVTEINAGRFNTTQNFYAEAGLNLVDEYVGLHHLGDGLACELIPGYRLKRDDECLWVRQPDMGHKLVTRSRVTA